MKKNKTRDLITGEIILVSSGRHEDYGVYGVFNCKKGFNPDEEVKCYLTERPEERNTANIDESEYRLLCFLIQKGLIERIPTSELYLGYFGDHDVGIRESSIILIEER